MLKSLLLFSESENRKGFSMSEKARITGNCDHADAEH